MRIDKIQLHMQPQQPGAVDIITKAIGRCRLLLLAVCLLCFSGAKAQFDGGIEQVYFSKVIGGVSPAGVDSLALTVSQSTIIDYTIMPLESTQVSKKIKNIISFGINEEAEKFITADFTASVEVKIEYGHTSSSLSSITKTFNVSYNKDAGVRYNAQQYFTFDNAEYVKITVMSVTAPTVGSLATADILGLKNEMRVTRYFELPSSVPAPAGFGHTTPTGPVPDHLEVNFSWPAATGHNATQLEWVWLEDELVDNFKVGGVLNLDLLFKNNATRVDLSYATIHYDIPLLYDGTGKLYYRIRPVNIKPNGNRSDGPWTMGTSYAYSFTNGHNNYLNWQATTTFAEEGKRKSVIQYYDGSLRPRQTVTKDNSTNTVVTAETFFDAQGRPTIQILPAPGISNILQYQSGLNRFNGQTTNQDPAEIFDMEPVATPNSLTPELLTSAGTSNYYSPYNPDATTGINARIPDAGGYPYTVTRYTPDATGRVLTQSGVGVAHNMGSGHETKYYYGGASQEELDGLFGTEVGNFSHYFKNMVKDANGQMSVSYADMHGRTVATALAGETPGALQALDKNNAAHYPNQAGSTITRNLLDNGTNVIKGNSIESINSILVPSTTTYQFQYQLNAPILTMPGCAPGGGGEAPNLCYDCLYDLEIAIVDESGETVLPITVRKYTNVTISPDDNCSTAQAPIVIVPGNDAISGDITGSTISFSKSLPIGSYSIRKTLTISESSFQHYKDLFISKALCKTEQEIIDSVYATLAGNCDAVAGTVNCQSCKDSLGTFTQYRDKYLNSLGILIGDTTTLLMEEIRAGYASGSSRCAQLCNNISQSLPMIREMMLADMMPYGGQYAEESAQPGQTTMFAKYNIFSIATPAVPHQPYYKNPWKSGAKNFYYNDQGLKDITVHDNPAAGHEYDLLNTLTKAEFTQLFKNSWAESLLPHHPEYERLLFAEANLTPSYNWINDFNQTETYAEAYTKGYLSPVGNDPFFAIVSPATINTAVSTNYAGIGNGMWQLAYGDQRCKQITDVVAREACYDAAPASAPPSGFTGFTTAENDQAWKIFRGLYSAERERQLNVYVATQRPLADVTDLITQKYHLWFPENEQQVAAQNGWSSWWPSSSPGTTPPGTPPGSNTTPAQQYNSRCSSYIQMWKTQLLKCEALASHVDKDAILTEITNRMVIVCENGSSAAYPYGSSTVAPTTPLTFTDRSFEDVIRSVFIERGILTLSGTYNNNFCNPFVIEWPKPYGKGPKMIGGEMTTGIDSCNCNQYNTVKLEAQSQSVNVLNLTEMNTWLLANYGETLTPEMFNALQRCNAAAACQCNELDSVVNLFYLAYPNGGLDTCRNPKDLDIDSRTPNETPEYVAGHSIYFLPGFEMSKSDSGFVAHIAPCDSLADCHQKFVDFFNDYYHYDPPYTWNQIDSIYLNSCGHTPMICGVKDPSCETFTKIVCKFLATTTVNASDTAARKAAFVIYFNNYFHNQLNYNWESIVDTYIGCDENLQLSICSSVSLPSCADVTCADVLPVIFNQAQPMPDFLKCGYIKNPRCVSCANLSTLTSEFKTKFTSPENSGPIFSATDLTPLQIGYNMSYARFLNYRTGFQFGWLDYAKAANAATPSCNLETPGSNGSATQNVICGDAHPLTDTTGMINYDTACHDVRIMAIGIGQEIYRIRKQYLLEGFEAAYKARCLASANLETFNTTYTNSEYHYTLYYYDMGGNLVKTVPPKGVRPDFSTLYTNQVKSDRASGTPNLRPHEFITQYRYNTLGQVIAQNTPDAGTSLFWYDKLGRLVVSQNAQQYIDNKFSYTLYDDLGRISEVGQKPQTTGSMSQTVSQDPVALLAWINTNGGTKEQITFTKYDEPYAPFLVPDPPIVQENLRNRVSYTATKNLATDADHFTGSFYTYDIHGNVGRLLQDYKGISAMNSNAARFKAMDYDYDLISGKVNQVSYQAGQADAFYHRYAYDAENRLTFVKTSRDKIVWERDASYNYYKHGPLARGELGQLRVQGTDYAYTLQGWLKGTNNTDLNVAHEINKDGSSFSPVAKDVLSYALHYYDQQGTGNNYQDYTPIGGSPAFAAPGSGTGFATKSLYNGNIAAMSVNNAGLLKLNSSTNNTMPLFYQYGYDQLNRIVSMQAYKGLDAAANTWTPVSINDYAEAVSYDPNGNIETYNRKGAPSAGMQTNMDDLGYEYYSNTNKLKRVSDNVAYSGYYSDDIDHQYNANNYTYDAIGNLIGDAEESITGISWTVYGKIKTITKTSAAINYDYDASGNRISKQTSELTTVYVRDASGNVMSIYEAGEKGLAQKELHLYGSSRLGLQTELTVPVETGIAMEGDFTDASLATFTRGEKIFELSNHLGNVLTTISDKKLQVSVWRKIECGFAGCYPTGVENEGGPGSLLMGAGGGGTGSWDGPYLAYRADIMTANDYYPFGMQMPGRKYTATGSYRYGFNGKENDNEVKGEGNSLDFGERMLDTRIGKWLSIDKLYRNYPYISPYSFVFNTPLQAVDPDGEKVLWVNGYYNTGKLSKMAGSSSGQAYWSPSFIAEGNKYMNDNINQFIDGRGKWNSSGKERYNEGYEYAKSNYADLISGMKKDEKGNIIETFKVVSHSMGAAYSEGIIKYLEEKGLKVEKVVHFSPADPSTFNSSSKPLTIQLNLEYDGVLMYKNFGEDNMISGVDKYGQVETSRGIKDDLNYSHADTKSDPDVFNMLRDLENVQMKQTNNTISTPMGTYTGPSNKYIPTGNTNGTQFNFLYLKGIEYKGTDTPNSYKGPLKP